MQSASACERTSRSVFDLNGTLKAMFRVRGETNRIDVADGLGRSSYVAANLQAEFDAMIKAIRRCLRYRNAHAIWHDPDMGKNLCYVSLEELAKEADEVPDLKALTFFFIDEPLLLQQELFFEYSRSLISYVNAQGQANRTGLRRQYQLPTPVAPPPFYNRKT